jgi:DNA-binding NarL/FixJ family response regulator
MIRILLAHSKDASRQHLRRLIERQCDWRVCAAADSGEKAVQLAIDESPDIVILDIALTGINAIEAARQIKQARLESEILVLTPIAADDLMRDLLRVGVKACLVNEQINEHLTAAVDALSQHRPYLNESVARTVLSSFLASNGSRKHGPSAYGRLTSREREIFQLFAEGRGNSAISNLLAIRIKTVQTHRTRIMKKLGLGSLAELVRYAIRHGLVHPL